MSHVRSFGARGDGKTDDTSAVQHAVDMGDGVIEFGKGVFRITRPIIVDTTQQGFQGIRGEQGTATVWMEGIGPAFRIIGNHNGTATPSTVTKETWANERMPIISGIEILGGHPKAEGIELVRTMMATIQNVLIRRCQVGIRLSERNRNFILSAAHIFDCHDTGLFFDQCNLHQAIITGNHISYCKRAGIRQWNGDVHNIQITGNDIEYNSGSDGTTGEIVLEAPEGTISEYTISSNTLQATLPAQGANVWIQGQGPSSLQVRLINITGNVLGSRDQSILIDRGSKVSITGNTIYGGASRNIRVINSADLVIGSNVIGTKPAAYTSKAVDGLSIEKSSGCNITGNVITHSSSPNGAVEIRQSRDIAVSSNQIQCPSHVGVLVDDSQRCRISDNSVVSDETAEQEHSRVIEVKPNSRNVLIQNNAMTAGRDGDVIVPSESGRELNSTVWK